METNTTVYLKYPSHSPLEGRKSILFTPNNLSDALSRLKDLLDDGFTIDRLEKE